MAESMNRVNLDKLPGSKWTAVNPVNRERHFVVRSVNRDSNNRIVSCEIEAVINGNCYDLDWRRLKDSDHWIPGWRS